VSECELFHMQPSCVEPLAAIWASERSFSVWLASQSSHCQLGVLCVYASGAVTQQNIRERSAAAHPPAPVCLCCAPVALNTRNLVPSLAPPTFTQRAKSVSFTRRRAMIQRLSFYTCIIEKSSERWSRGPCGKKENTAPHLLWESETREHFNVCRRDGMGL
jgi:hypothetical protein